MNQVCDARFYRVLSPQDVSEPSRLIADAKFAALTHRAFPDLRAEVFDECTQLRGITVFATGWDRIDVEALTRRGILLCHLPDYSQEPVAEHALGLMLCLARRIHLSSAKVLGHLPESVSVRGSELAGKRLGIVGCGRIGQRVAELARAFGMSVIGFDQRDDIKTPVPRRSLEEVWETSDWITLHHPAHRDNAVTYGREMLESVKPGAFLINVARAGLVDSEAVLAALNSGRLAGYAVDDRVFTSNDASDLIRQGRILQTGHTAWYSQEALDRGYSQLMQNVIDMAMGRPQWIVNPEAWGLK